jgi:hypothetical protein
MFVFNTIISVFGTLGILSVNVCKFYADMQEIWYPEGKRKSYFRKMCNCYSYI